MLDVYRFALAEVPGFAPVELVCCTQGEAAVAAAREAYEQGSPFGSIFMDVRMPPGIDGVAAAERIRAFDPDVRIIIVTGFSNFEIQEIQRRVPPPDKLTYVRKPCEIFRLRELANHTLGAWVTCQRPEDPA